MAAKIEIEKYHYKNEIRQQHNGCSVTHLLHHLHLRLRLHNLLALSSLPNLLARSRLMHRMQCRQRVEAEQKRKIGPGQHEVRREERVFVEPSALQLGKVFASKYIPLRIFFGPVARAAPNADSLVRWPLP